MTIKQLTYFLRIAETCNLTKAAQMLHVSQPPLSYQLKILEQELGVELFIRSAHNLRITEEGMYLQDKAAQILALVDKTSDELRNFAAQAAVQINLGTITSVSHEALPWVVKQYKEKHPNAVFNIYDGNSRRITELLDNNVIDIGILREPFNKELYTHVRIRNPCVAPQEDDYFVAVGKKEFFPNPEPDTITLAELATYPLVLHRRFEDSFTVNCCQKNLTPNIVSRNDNIMTSITWAVNGLGVSVMPYSSAMLITGDNMALKKIVDPVSYSNLYLIWNPSNTLSHYTREFVELFQSVPG